MRKPNKREGALLAVALTLVIMAAGAGNFSNDNAAPADDVTPAAKSRTQPKSPADAADADVVRTRRAAIPEEPPDLFAGKSWYVPPPPPPPAKPAPPPAPTAPPLPFTYLGRYQEGSKPVLFLVRSNQVLTVSVGDIIEGTYRVDAIVGMTLTLTYLPLNMKQTLDIGGAG
jgi:hypothetical protein